MVRTGVPNGAPEAEAERSFSTRAISRPSAEPMRPQVTRADALNQASAESPTAAVHAELPQARGDLTHGDP